MTRSKGGTNERDAQVGEIESAATHAILSP